MTIQNAESILVIIVSTTLTLFLIAAITVLVLIGQLVQAIRRIVDRAEHMVESAEEAATMLKNASGPLALFKVVRNMLVSMEKTSANKRGDKDE